jgi:hypothetical protein
VGQESAEPHHPALKPEDDIFTTLPPDFTPPSED